MKIRSYIPILISLIVLNGACKKYKPAKLSFGSGAEVPEGEGDTGEGDSGAGAGEGEGEGEGEAEGEGAESGEEGSETEGSASAESVESLALWSGSSTFGKASGEGCKVDGKSKMLTLTSKAVFGDISDVGKAQAVSEDQIGEVMAIVAAAKVGTPNPMPTEACDKTKLLAINHIVIVQSGVEEIILTTEAAKCQAKRYIDYASFQKITTWLKTNFPAVTTGTTPTTTP